MATHLENRVAMARRLIDFLDQHLPAGITLDALELDWDRIAEMAGESRIPSFETRACVLTGLRERRLPCDASLLEGLPR
jgi:hypothetical protein